MTESWGNTQWFLSCPRCGDMWTVTGRGRWLERKLSSPGPSFPPVGSMVTHKVARSELCESCWADKECELDDKRLAAAQLRALSRRIEKAKTSGLRSGGFKVCVRCFNLYRPARVDSCYCSTRCKKATARRLERLRSGRPLSEAMLHHDQPWPHTQRWEWWAWA